MFLRVGIIVMSCVLYLFCCLNINAQSDKSSKEYDLKGAYIYHFARYITWANEDDAEKFIINIVGDSPIMESLKKLEHKRIKDKHVRVENYRSLDAFCQANKKRNNEQSYCQILFITKEAKSKSGKHTSKHNVLSDLACQNILLLGEADDFLTSGGFINFVIQRNRLKFCVNQDALLSNSGFSVSSKLLRLAILSSPQKTNPAINKPPSSSPGRNAPSSFVDSAEFLAGVE